MSCDDTEPGMTRGWITLSSDSYVQIPNPRGMSNRHLKCNVSNTRLQVFALTHSTGSLPISGNSNAILLGPQLEFLWLLSFSHISRPIYQQILQAPSSRYIQIPPLLIASTTTTPVQAIIIPCLYSCYSLLIGLLTSTFARHSLSSQHSSGRNPLKTKVGWHLKEQVHKRTNNLNFIEIKIYSSEDIVKTIIIVKTSQRQGKNISKAYIWQRSIWLLPIVGGAGNCPIQHPQQNLAWATISEEMTTKWERKCQWN